MRKRKHSSLGRKLLSGYVLRVSSLVAAALASFFLMPFIVHHLGDRAYGFWSLAAAFIGYYSLLDLGLSSAISQYMCIAIGHGDHTECRVVFNTALLLQFLLGGAALLATSALVLATPWICRNPADVHLFRSVIAILGTCTALGFPARVYSAVINAELRFDIQSWLANLGVVLRTGLIVWAVLAGGGLLALAWVTLLATLPVSALQIWYARREASWARIGKSFFKPKMVRSFFSYGAYNFLAYIGDIVRFQLDPLVISGLIGLAAVTHYRVAGVLAQYYLQVIIVSVGALSPVLSRLHGAGNRTALEEVFFFGTKLSICAAVFICLAFAGWGRPFIIRWMGPSYLDGYLPLVVLSLAVFLDVSQKPSIDLLFATFKHRIYAWINCTEAAANLALSVVLARPFGILGVAMGTLIAAFAFRVIVQPWWVCKVSGLSYSGYMRFLGSNLLRCACLAGAAIAIAAWSQRPTYLWMGTSAICATGIYAGGAWLLVFNRKERAQVLRAFRWNDKLRQSELVTEGGAVQQNGR